MREAEHDDLLPMADELREAVAVHDIEDPPDLATEELQKILSFEAMGEPLATAQDLLNTTQRKKLQSSIARNSSIEKTSCHRSQRGGETLRSNHIAKSLLLLPTRRQAAVKIKAAWLGLLKLRRAYSRLVRQR